MKWNTFKESLDIAGMRLLEFDDLDSDEHISIMRVLQFWIGREKISGASYPIIGPNKNNAKNYVSFINNNIKLIEQLLDKKILMPYSKPHKKSYIENKDRGKVIWEPIYSQCKYILLFRFDHNDYFCSRDFWDNKYEVN